MRLFKKVLLSILALFIVESVCFSQSVPDGKSFKIRSSYRNGEYDRSNRLCDLIIKKYDQGKVKNTFIYTEALEYKIKNTLEISDRKDKIKPFVNSYLDVLSSLDKEQLSYFIIGLSKLSTIYAEFGFYKLAKQNLDKANRLNKEYSPKGIENILNLNNVYALNKLGFYKDANSIALKNRAKIISHFGDDFNFIVPSGKNISGTYTSKYLIEQKRNIADFFNEIASIKYNQGDYLTADSLLNSSYDWILQNIDQKGRDVSAFDNRMLTIQNLEKLGKKNLAYKYAVSKSINSNEGLRKSLDKTFKGYSYYKNSEAYMNYEEFLARYYWKSNYYLNTGKISTANGYYQRHRSVYERMGQNRNNVNIIKAELLHLDKYLITNKNEDALGKIDTLLNKKSTDGTKSFIPENHPNKRKLILKALEIYSKLGLSDKTSDAISMLEKIDMNLLNQDSPLVIRDKLYIALLKSEVLDKNKEAEKIFSKILDNGNPTHLYIASNEYNRYNSEYIHLLIRMGHFEKAEARIKKSVSYSKKLEFLHPEHFVQQQLLLAELSIEIGDFKKADEILNPSKIDGTIYKHISKKSFENRNLKDDYYRLSMRKNLVYGYLKKASLDYENIKHKSHEDKINKSPFYISTGKFEEAKKTLDETIQLIINSYGHRSRRLISAYNYLSNINAKSGEFSGASNLKAIEIAKENFGANSWQYADARFIEGQSNSILGDYHSAIIELSQAKDIYSEIYGKQHIKYASALSELSLAQLYNGDKSKQVEQNLIDASKIIISSVGNNSYENATVLQNLSFYHLESNDIPIAEANLQESIDILINLGVNNYKLKLAENYRVQGKIQQYSKEYSKSESSLKKSLNYFKDIFSNKDHIEIVQTRSSLAQLYYLQGERKDSKKTLNKTTEIYLNYINKYFNYLTEREKKEFWKKINLDFEFYKTLAFENNTPSEVETVYNHTLNTKALLLNSSKKLRNAIQKSNDEGIKKLFNEWLEKQELLTQSLSSNNEELKEKGIDIQSLQKEVDKLEKTLGERSNAFALSKSEQSTTWKDVRSKLKADEYAIEIIRYRQFENSFTNNVKYKALILGPNSETPQVVDLKEGNLLDKRYLSFYRNATKFKTKDPYSYEAYFEPIHKIVGDNKKLYISLDGVYNLINLEALKTPDGEYIIDKNEIIIVSNTKELVTNPVRNVSEIFNKNAMIIGNPMYYANNISSTSHENVDDSQNVNQLPGAEAEGKSIQSLFTQNSWDSKLYTWDEAEEDLIKSIGKEGKKYSYVHISTHGFFKPQQSKKTLASELDYRRGLDDPYLRAGLIFKNGGEIVDNNGVLNYNKKDGVLTAKEVANLNLEGVEMVVLSACETGLGRVSSGEGVYGLQRAFQTAGAKVVIISLFKVDDEVTKLFMEKMTKKLLEINNKREALLYAKKEVRKLYPDPIYWGSFVMIE